MDDIFERIAAGDARARNEIIERLYKPALKRVHFRLRALPSMKHFRDDLEGVALLALTETVDAIIGRPIQYPQQYVETAIDRAINDAILAEENQGHSARSQQRAIAKGVELDAPSFEPLNDQSIDRSSGSDVDALEVILLCCEDELDRRIVELRRLGHTDDEVAEITNRDAGYLATSRSAIQSRRTRLEARFLAMMREDE